MRRSVAAAFLTAALVAGCGGGGGGGGGAPGGGSPSTGPSIAFTGFSFRSGSGFTTETPPMEDPGATPPKVGAALNTVVVFHFDGIPGGVLNQTVLPVYTTPAEVTPEAKAPATLGSIPAKGTYVLVVDEGADLYTVEFRPFIPSGQVTPDLSADPSKVPGLLPASVYTAQVSTKPGSKIPNLGGPGGSVKFGTTSNEAAYFPSDPSDSSPPTVVYTDDTGALVTTPADGADDFYPGTWSAAALDSPTDTFPDGPSDVMLVYDRRLRPDDDNIVGSDLDGDGLFDPTFFFRTRATEFIVGHHVAADAVAGAPAHGAFDALSTFLPGEAGDPTGGRILLHDSAEVGLPGQTGGIVGPIKSAASGRDASLLYVVSDVVGGTDRLTVGDAFAGDPTHAGLAVDMPGGVEITVDTGLDDLVGLEVLLDGRLVGFDRTTSQVVELLVSLERMRPRPDKPEADPPVLEGLSLGDGVEGFRSASWPGGLQVYDLAQAPSGRLFALATLAGSTFPSLIEIAGIDPDLDGAFAPEDGTWSGSPDDVVVAFGSQVEQLEFVTERQALVLDRSTDALQLVDLETGAVTPQVTHVAGFDLPLPGGLSPATTLALGELQIDLQARLADNDIDGAVVALEPEGVLPVDADVLVMQRNTLTSLSGVSELNADPAQPRTALGAVQVLRLATAAPLAGAGAPIDDAFIERFEDTHFANTQPLTTNPEADWAEATPSGSGTTGRLRASVGASETAQLGDFRPQPQAGFDTDLAYVRSGAGLGEPSLDWTRTDWTVVVLDTDAQSFPLPDGSTPGVTQPSTVFGGHFVFRDFIIPAGVRVVVRGTRPLRITATGTVSIDGVLDLSGTDGLSDDTFNSGFLPVPGGGGGPGGGRGGDGHPTRFDPKGTGQIWEYVTPERAGRGVGPLIDASGNVVFKEIGGFGGLSSLGYDPAGNGLPKLDEFENREEHRPPGGGGGSFYTLGDQAHRGTGSYVVQSDSTWFPFDKCTGVDDNIRGALYGNDEFIVQGLSVTPLQCVYMLGTPSDPQRFLPGGLPGDAVFKDGDPLNDFIGEGGELPVLIGGQGGGGGGTRIDSMRQRLWSANAFGAPDQPPPLGPPHYTKLFFGLYFSPTLYDAKGGGGGGGGGSVQLRSYGDIRIGRLGHIDARGGHGGGGEVVQNANFAGGAGGGSGGAVLLQAAGDIVIEADPGHRTASYADADGDMGASIEVSGGFGRDARADPTNKIDFIPFDYDSTRSDGGQGGMGLIQLQAGGSSSTPLVEQGAFLFAKKRATLKLGKWTGDNVEQEQHPTWATGGNDLPPDVLRYIEMVHYRYFTPDTGNAKDRYMVLNGSWPPLIPSDTGDNGHGVVNEYPAGSGQLWWDTAMMSGPLSSGRVVVQEPEPEKVMKSYLGWDPVTFLEPFWQTNAPPGTLYDAGDVIPMVVNVLEPDGTPPMVDEGAGLVFDPASTLDRLPVVPLDLTPVPLGTISRGTSRWLAFHGVGLRGRDPMGRPPPFFEPIHGTFNPGVGIPGGAGDDGKVRLGAAVPSPTIPARYVVDAGVTDPGLFPGSGVGEGVPPNPPRNDIKVDAPDAGIGLEDVVTDNASVMLEFQGAYPVRPGSSEPDPSTLTDWLSDPTQLDGYPLVRFRVSFDLAVDTDNYPFGVDSLRPGVDTVRLRAGY